MSITCSKCQTCFNITGKPIPKPEKGRDIYFDCTECKATTRGMVHGNYTLRAGHTVKKIRLTMGIQSAEK